MIKTYRLPVVAMAQGLRGGYGYNDTVFSTGQEFYTNTNVYPVSIQFAKLPVSLEPFTPKSATLYLYCGNASGTQAKGERTGEYRYEPPIYPAPSDAELKEEAEGEAIDYKRYSCYKLAEKTDISNGFITLVREKNYTLNPGYISGTITTGTVTRKKMNYESPYTWYRYEVPYTITYTGYSLNDIYSENSQSILSIIQNGILFNAHKYPETRIYAPSDTIQAYLDIDYNTIGTTVITSELVGYIDSTAPLDFSWRTTYSGFPVETITQTSATLEWKDGESGTAHQISLPGNTTTYTMPAGTLPDSLNILWRVTTQTADGTTVSQWKKFQTIDSIPSVTAVSPSGTYVDGTDIVRFIWNYTVDTGTAQTAYNLQYKTTTGNWTDVQSENTANQYADVPAGTLPAGNLQWRVRAYNQDGAASDWSNALDIVVISAPTAPQVRVTSVSPRPTIEWTATGQQAYQVTVGDYDSGLMFGTGKSYKVPVYLADGQQRAQIRVMNTYGLWSPYGYADFTVDNSAPATAPVLTGQGGRDAGLTWTASTGAALYLIYRGTDLIAETAQTEYTDRFANGLNRYFVRAVFSGTENYADSNPVQVLSSPDCAMICDIDTGEWIDLRYSTIVLPQTQITSAQEIAMMQYSGAAYPVPEISNFKTQTYTINTAFLDAATADRFENLIGKTVCVKDHYGNIMIGMMTSTTKMQSKLYRAYSATVNRIER